MRHRPVVLERAASGEGLQTDCVRIGRLLSGSESLTMGWVAFLIAVLYVCLGFAAGTLLSRRNAAAAAASAPPAPPDEDQAFTFRSDQAAEFLDRIHKLTFNVDQGVDRHATRVAEISGGLSGEQRLTVNAAEAAAAGLLEANQQLQHDLASAKEELKTQRRPLDSYMAEY